MPPIFGVGPNWWAHPFWSIMDINLIVFEVVKALLVAAIGVMIKMYTDILRLKSDMDAAHKKLRDMERNYDDKHSVKDSGGSRH